MKKLILLLIVAVAIVSLSLNSNLKQDVNYAQGINPIMLLFGSPAATDTTHYVDFAKVLLLADTVDYLQTQMDLKAPLVDPTFTNIVIVNDSLTVIGVLNVGSNIYRYDDADTYIRMDADKIRVYAGGVEFMQFIEGGGDEEFIVNDGGVDMNFRVETNNEDSAFFSDGTNRLRHIEGDLVLDGSLNKGVDTSATTDDYKIVIASLGSDGFINSQILWVDVKNGSGTPADNTGACQLYVNSNAAVDIKTQNGGDPAASWIDVNSVFGVIFDGTNFLLITPDANP